MQVVIRTAALALCGLALAAGSASAGGPGPLFGLVNGDGQAALTHVDPLNLQPTSARVPLGVFSRAWSFSADRTRLVVASSHNSTLGRPSALRFVDLGRMRRDGDLVLAGETDRIAGTAWTGGRVLALVVGERTAHVVAVDPDARRVVGRVALDGTVRGGAATAGGLVLLLAPRERIGPARLAVVDSRLRVRSAVLERITAGWETHGSGESLRAQAQIPALAVAGGRAYVLGAGGEPSAEIDLATLAVTYREERLLARAAKPAKQIDQKARFTAWVGGGLLAVGRQDLDTLKRHAANGVSVLDVRPPPMFLRGHIPGTYGIWSDAPLTTWAGWLIPMGAPLLLVAHGPRDLESAVRQLIRIGFDDLRGHLDGGMAAWESAGLPVERVPLVALWDLAAKIGKPDAPVILDVRQDDEWADGHIPGAVHIENGRLPWDDLPFAKDAQIVVHCHAGNRSTSGISVLLRRGYTNVASLAGGWGDWAGSGFPIETG